MTFFLKKHILLLTILCFLNIIEQHMCRVKVMQYSLASNILKGYAKCIFLHSKHQILFLVSCRKKVCSDTVNLFLSATKYVIQIYISFNGARKRRKWKRITRVCLFRFKLKIQKADRGVEDTEHHRLCFKMGPILPLTHNWVSFTLVS